MTEEEKHTENQIQKILKPYDIDNISYTVVKEENIKQAILPLIIGLTSEQADMPKHSPRYSKTVNPYFDRVED